MSEIDLEYNYPKSALIVLCSEFFHRYASFELLENMFPFFYDWVSPGDKGTVEVIQFWYNFSLILMILMAIVADQSAGKYWICVIFWAICSVGSLGFVLGTLNTGLIAEFSWMGLAIVAVSSGSASCLITLGGDQFKMPEQKKYASQYFSYFFWTKQLSDMISWIVPSAVTFKCLGEDSCYFVVMALICGSIIIATFILLCSRSAFEVVKHEAILFKIMKIIFRALKKKIGRDKEDVREHWLDYASDKYSEDHIMAAKAIWGCLPLFLTFALNKSIFQQQIENWKRQTELMKGSYGGVVITYETILSMKYGLVITFIPMMEFLVYPITEVCQCMTSLLQRIGVANILLIFGTVATLTINYFVRVSHQPMSVHILWLIIPMGIVSLAQVIMEIQGTYFAYSQAPYELKAFVMACWLATYYGGKKILQFISEKDVIKSNTVVEGILFTLMSFLNFGAFIFFAIRYEYKDFKN